jgi:UDP-2-acetamido-2-deoxy-ribo-hexuluronate aminotransferase
MKFIDINTEYKSFKKEIDFAIKNIANKGNFILGKENLILENKLKKLTGAKYCSTVSSGTDGLMLALKTLNLKPTDEIIIPDFTYVSPAEVSAILKYKIKFVDVDKDTFLIDTLKLKKKINKNTKVIIAVSLFGQCPDFDKIKKIIKNQKITIIEDAAQSLGSKYKNKFSCNIADISVTSFFPTKTLGCFGDGGAIFTNKLKYHKKILALRNHGQFKKKYHHEIVGFNARLDTLQAAILLVKIKYFKKSILNRKKIALIYFDKLKNCNKIQLPKICKFNESVFAQFTIKTKLRSKLIKIFKSQKIPFAIYYPKILSEQKAFKQLENNKISKTLTKDIISIPFSAYLKETDQTKVIRAIHKL